MAIDLVIEPRCHTIWTQPGAAPRLHQPPGAVWPYSSHLTGLGYTWRDLYGALPYLDMAVRPPGTARVRALISLFAVALARTSDSDSALHIVILHLALARDLACALVLFPSPGEISHARARAFDRALDRARALARALELELDRDRALALARALALDLDLARALELDLDRDLDRALDRAHDRNLDRDLARDLARNLARALDRNLDRARDLPLDRARIGSVDLDHLVTHIQDLDDLGRALTHDIDASGPRSDITSESAFALDIVLDQNALMADIQRQRRVIDAFSILLAQWAPSRGRRPREGRALSAFIAYLESIVTETPEPAIRKIPGVALREAADLVESGAGGLGSSARDQVRRLLGHVGEQIRPILERTAPLDAEALGYARIELLAVAALLRDAKWHDAAALVVELIRGLVAIQEREAERLIPNEVLLLVRA